MIAIFQRWLRLKVPLIVLIYFHRSSSLICFSRLSSPARTTGYFIQQQDLYTTLIVAATNAASLAVLVHATQPKLNSWEHSPMQYTWHHLYEQPYPTQQGFTSFAAQKGQANIQTQQDLPPISARQGQVCQKVVIQLIYCSQNVNWIFCCTSAVRIRADLTRLNTLFSIYLRFVYCGWHGRSIMFNNYR